MPEPQKPKILFADKEFSLREVFVNKARLNGFAPDIFKDISAESLKKAGKGLVEIARAEYAALFVEEIQQNLVM